MHLFGLLSFFVCLVALINASNSSVNASNSTAIGFGLDVIASMDDGLKGGGRGGGGIKAKPKVKIPKLPKSTSTGQTTIISTGTSTLLPGTSTTVYTTTYVSSYTSVIGSATTSKSEGMGNHVNGIALLAFALIYMAL